MPFREGTLDPAPPQPREVFFALVGPSGSDLGAVIEALRAELCAVDFALVPPIKLADMLHGLKPYEELQAITREDERIEAHMNAGDEVRSVLKDGGAVAALAIAELNRLREDNNMGPRRAFLFKSLKHPGEIRLLRHVYGASLVVISVYEPKPDRERRLARRIERSHGQRTGTDALARKLIERDERGSEEDDYGQSVRETFPLADFFVRAGPDLQPHLQRLIQILCNHPFQTPSPDEQSMFLARSSALRSGDLSRQVGAVIVNSKADVLAMGCNEVPRYGGGTYWQGDRPDGRDYCLGEDPNAIMRREILSEIVTEMQRSNWLDKSLSGKAPSEIVAQALDGRMFDNSRVSSLVEFGRVVHAEMNAIAEAARRGISVDGAVLYCTTFPCHGCARHLLAAGIKEVVYIEPYPKSLAEEMYPEAIAVDGSDAGRLLFRPFIGVAPARYLAFFDYGKRKDRSGYAVKWEPRNSDPKRAGAGNEHMLIERELCENLKELLLRQGWIDDKTDAA